jgi:hypothetical protein
MLKYTKLIAAIVLVIGLVALLVQLAAFFVLGSEDKVEMVGNPTASLPAAQPATAPTTEPAKPSSWDIPALVSPASISPAADPAIAKLIDAHNANQSRIASANLTAQCTWTLDTTGDPRPMTIHYTREGEKAEMTCGKESCSVAMGHVKMAPGSALNVDGLYLLMFRKFDGGQFKPVKAETPGTLRAATAREILDFDATSGRLVRAEIQAKEGQVVATFADYVPLKDNPQAMIPTKIDITVPSDLYPFYRAADGKISLTVQR